MLGIGSTMRVVSARSVMAELIYQIITTSMQWPSRLLFQDFDIGL